VSLPAEALRQLENGLRIAADAVAKLLDRRSSSRRRPRPPSLPKVELTDLDRARARAAARRCGLKVFKP